MSESERRLRRLAGDEVTYAVKSGRAKLEFLKQNITHVLVKRIEPIVGEDYELSLIARHKTNDEAHILITVEEDLEEIVRTVRKLKEREPI